MSSSASDDRPEPDETADHVIDLRTPTSAAAGVFAVSPAGAATRIPVRADEYRDLVGHGPVRTERS